MTKNQIPNVYFFWKIFWCCNSKYLEEARMSIFSNKIYMIIGHWFIVKGWLNERNVLENIPIYENNIGTFLYFRFYDENYLNDGEHWHYFRNWTRDNSLTTVSYTKSTQKERFGKSLELTLESWSEYLLLLFQNILVN